MRLTVRLLDIPKLEDLIEDNEFIRKMLKPDPYGGWLMEANERQLIEIDRLLRSKGIKYTIKEI